jgi:phytoene dehydrogenase-like protein
VVHRSVDQTAAGLGVDASAWRRVYGRLARMWPHLASGLLGPVLRLPRHPIAMASLGVPGLLPATLLARWLFGDDEARAVFAGCAAHAILPLDRPLTSSFGLLFGVTAQTVGWPIARGGSQAISDALVSYLRSLGGEVECNRQVNRWDDLPTARAVLFDTIPTTLLRVAGDRISTRYATKLRRFRHGPGSFKLDLAIEGPIPWRDERAGGAGTVHIGGTLEEVMAAERSVWRGEHPERPYVLLSQPSVADDSRAPQGKQAVWAYCHVPAESAVDMTDRIEAQIERFAPGFRDRVLARSVTPPAELERHNPNYIGGDIAGGYTGWPQTFFRPRFALDPWTIGEGLFICSQSSPPGVGVHGLCGWYAARKALQYLR